MKTDLNSDFLWFFFFVLFRVVSVVRGLDLKNLDPNAQE